MKQLNPAPTDALATLESAQQHLERELAALRTSVHRATAWQTWVREHPLAAVGIALGVGAVVGLLLSPPETRRSES